MEDGLRDALAKDLETNGMVLILVLVEDGLRVNWRPIFSQEKLCLNPCSCGGWSQSYFFQPLKIRHHGS